MFEMVEGEVGSTDKRGESAMKGRVKLGWNCGEGKREREMLCSLAADRGKAHCAPTYPPAE